MIDYEQDSSCLIYHGFEIEEMPRLGSVPGYVRLIYDFEIPGISQYAPEFVIPSEEEDVGSEDTFINLAFHLGMAELMQYCYNTEIKTVVIEPFGLTKNQIMWWNDIYNSAINSTMTNVSLRKLLAYEEDVLPSAGFSAEGSKNNKWNVLLNTFIQIPLKEKNTEKSGTCDKSTDEEIENEFPWMADCEKNRQVEIIRRVDSDLFHKKNEKADFYVNAFAATIWAYIREQSYFTISTIATADDLQGFRDYEEAYIGSGTEIL